MNDIIKLIEPLREVGDNLNTEQVAEIVQKLDYYKTAIRDADKELKTFLLDWLDQPGRSLEIGTVRYYIGTKKKTVCTDVGKTIEALLTANGGDFGALVETLSSQPIKYGAAKKDLGESWGDYFAEIVEDDLKTGKAKKEIKSVDERFVKGGK